MQEKKIYDHRFIIYRPYTPENFERIPQIGKLTAQQQFEIMVVGSVLPFKTNNYVINELIHWDDPLNDPLFRLTFPQREMLSEHDYRGMAEALYRNAAKSERETIAHGIRTRLFKPVASSPFQAINHADPHSVLFHPEQAQTCHAWCTFCFKWPQFTGTQAVSFVPNAGELLVRYIRQHKNITELVFTGGDPLMMPTHVLGDYMVQLLQDLPDNLQTLVIETKALGYWPYRFTLDKDGPELLNLFANMVHQGIRLVIQAHFTHPAELSTKAVSRAIEQILQTGAEIRTQTTVLRHINDKPATWAELWQKQLEMGCTPQEMRVTRPTGTQDYFTVPLAEIMDLYKKAVRLMLLNTPVPAGPVMHCAAGKIQLVEVKPGEHISLVFLQGRNSEWNGKSFTAAYDAQACWIHALKPLTGEKFFFEEELENRFHQKLSDEAWGNAG